MDPMLNGIGPVVGLWRTYPYNADTCADAFGLSNGLVCRGRLALSETYHSRRDARSASPNDRQQMFRSRAPLPSYQNHQGFEDGAFDFSFSDDGASTVSCDSDAHIGALYQKPRQVIKFQGKQKMGLEQSQKPRPLTNVSSRQSPLFEPTNDLFEAPTRHSTPSIYIDNDCMPYNQGHSTGLQQPVSITMPDMALRRAQLLKTGLEKHSPLSTLSKKAKKSNTSRRLRVEDDPENILIKELRTKHNMQWTAIANYLNEKRFERGEPQTMTHPAVYSRFVRNAPRIAAANGELGFDPKDWMHLRKAYNYPNTASVARHATSQFHTSSENKENEIPRNMQVELQMMAKRAADNQELETGERTEQLVNAVAVVEANFWAYVAHELERTSGKAYKPAILESRWKAI